MIRARTEDQKEQRMNEIKDATKFLFSKMNYQAITLTTIAEKLGWSRANLYKYVTTKEEIFLEISADLMIKYFDSLMSAIPAGCNFSNEIIAEIWSGILNANKDYLKYANILTSIIEMNVTVERLAAFKAKYFECAYNFRDRLCSIMKKNQDEIYDLILGVLLYAGAIVSSCSESELMKQALSKINVNVPKKDLQKIMRNFILMNLEWNSCVD